MMEEVGVFISYGLIPVGGFTVLLFVLNLVRAPYLIDKEQQKRIDELSGRTVPDVDITLVGDIGILALPDTSTGLEEHFHYLFAEVGIVNRSNQKAVVEVKARIKFAETVWYVCSPLSENHIPGLELTTQLRPIINLGPEEGVDGFLVFSLTVQDLKSFGIDSIENLRDYKFCFEVHDRITKTTNLLPKEYKMLYRDLKQLGF